MDNFKKIDTILKELKGYSEKIIEASLIKYISQKKNMEYYYSSEFSQYRELYNDTAISVMRNNNCPANIEFVIELLQSFIDDGNSTENGIVFTPKYISDYICEKILSDKKKNNMKIIDPGCGCGVFLISAIDYLKSQGMSVVDSINNNIYGIDIDNDNARRAKIVLNLYAILNGVSNRDLTVNIICADSLKEDWYKLCGVNSFDAIIGNPPYVNTHNMNKDTAVFLKETFVTTKKGVYNIFYAFVERAMKYLDKEGELGYIVPNNFLTIKAACEFRHFISSNNYLKCIIDFTENMLFKSFRTYNCIIFLTKAINNTFQYAVIGKTDNVQNALSNCKFDSMETDKLDDNFWRLVDRNTQNNIQKIENQFISINDLIRTGIATLRDKLYMVHRDGNNYFKIVDGTEYVIDREIVKKIYKIPELNNSNDLEDTVRYIIFPYENKNGKYEIIPEDEMKKTYANTYRYLLTCKPELDKRDKGKGKYATWYAYGRTQGLNKYGKKLLFPTFASMPRFMIVEDKSALFCNGYGIFEHDNLDLYVIQKVLNSSVMRYYISNSSYQIEGGYYCYQKKYIERFSIPLFSQKELIAIKNMTNKQLDDFLFLKYDIKHKEHE